MTRAVEVVKSGLWRYDDSVETPVRIVRQNWDYYHEPGFDEDPPDLNESGQAYYVVWGAPSPPEPGSPYQFSSYPSRSRTCLSLEEAVELARQTLGSEIQWDCEPMPEPRG